MISNKVKISLIAICAFLIVSVFVVNVTERVTRGNNGTLESVIKHTNESGISRSYLAKMVSLLEYSKEELGLLEQTAAYEDVSKEAWCYPYINAMDAMNLSVIFTKEEGEFQPEKKVTYKEWQQIIVKAAEHSKEEQVKKDLPDLFMVKDAESELPWEVYIQGYQYLEDKVFEQKLEKKELYIVVTKRNIETLRQFETVTNVGTFTNNGLDMDDYIDLDVQAYTKDDEILYITSTVKKETTLANVYITGQKGRTLTVYVSGVERAFEMNNKLKEDVKDKVADVVIANRHIVNIQLKTETIREKVLSANDQEIELEGRGRMKLEKDFRVYRVYDKIGMEKNNAILVGYENTDFVVYDGKICAALITKQIKAQNIRVILYSSGYKSLFHRSVSLSSDQKFTMSYGGKKKTFDAGEEVVITKDSEYLRKGRLSVVSEGKDGKVKVTSIERSQGVPSYRGKIEVALADGGLTVVNELPLEQYLYAVIPSEMPTAYGLEALKVQAICARSYAYNHLVSNSCSKYGAHVDDSTTFQVYNNHGEEDLSIQAVDETYGEVLQYKAEVVFAYYFSTSCGTTADVRSVWLDSNKVDYLQGRFQGSGKNGEVNYSEEKAFYKFIKSNKVNTYEKDAPWYRWNVTIDFTDLRKMVDARLFGLYKKRPAYVLTRDTDGVYKKKPVNTVGAIKDINVSKRDKSGLATEMVIIGTKHTVKIKSESYIRQILGPTYDAVVRQDKCEVKYMSMLPSAFIVFDKVEEDGKMTGVKISGGGYGHGVGMSQNGVKELVDAGKSYEDVLKYYYTGIEVGRIY